MIFEILFWKDLETVKYEEPGLPLNLVYQFCVVDDYFSFLFFFMFPGGEPFFFFFWFGPDFLPMILAASNIIKLNYIYTHSFITIFIVM